MQGDPHTNGQGCWCGGSDSPPPYRKSFPALVSERDVQHFWAAHLFRSRRLLCEDGSSLVIEFPGLPNAESGPDFRDARIWISGELRVGDVEIHLTSSGWEGHHHEEGGHYRNVILHVALWRDREVPFRSGFRLSRRPALIPELVLESFLGVSPAELRNPLAGRHAVLDQMDASASGTLLSRLDTLGKARFEGKSAYFERLLSRIPPDEVLYRGIMTALGYKRNKAVFYELARLLSFSELRRAALDRDDPCRAVADRLVRTSELCREWRTSHQRPANHPLRRLYGIVPFLALSLEMGPVEVFRNILTESVHVPPDAAGGQRVWRRLEEPFRGRTGVPWAGRLGRERIHQIIANIILPFFHAYGCEEAGSGSFRAFVERLFVHHPAPEGDSVTRVMLAAVGGDPSMIQTVAQYMGLLQLRAKFPKPEAQEFHKF